MPSQPSVHHQQAFLIQPAHERILSGDVWGTCLSTAFSADNLVQSCPPSVRCAWSLLSQRLTALFPLIDPSIQLTENRASSLLRSSTKKPTNERDQLIPLWHNYAVIGCCIAPNSAGARTTRPRSNRYSNSDALSTETTTAPSSSIPADPIDKEFFTTSTARDLIKLLVPLLRCEQADLRDSAVIALGRVSPIALRDLLDELSPLLKEAVERKQENIRRRRRRDTLRASLTRLIALLCQSGVFTFPESDAFTPQGQLISCLTDFLDGVRIYLDSVSDQTAPFASVSQTPSTVASLSSTGIPLPAFSGSPGSLVTTLNASFTASSSSTSAYINFLSTDAYLLLELRNNLCIIILELIRQMPKGKRIHLLPTSLRYPLFRLISHWNGFHDNASGFTQDTETSTIFPGLHVHTSSVMGSSPGSADFIAQSDSPQIVADPTSIASSQIPYSGTQPPVGFATTFNGQRMETHSVGVADNWESRLWTDMVWSANQAMGALLCCGPVYDSTILFGSDQLTTTADSSGPSVERHSLPGVGLRWVMNLLVMRDAAYDASPWMWYCPVLESPAWSTIQLTKNSCSAYCIQPSAASVFADRRLDSMLRHLGEETLCLLLDSNRNTPALLKWTIDQCYSAMNSCLSTACFTSIARVFANNPELPYDFIPLFVLSLVFLDHPRKTVSDRAFFLLRLLYHRFIIKPIWSVHQLWHARLSTETSCSQSGCSSSSKLCTELQVSLRLWHSMSRWSPGEVIRQLAAQHPDLTLAVFSEITKRVELSRECLRANLLKLLTPWIINIELFDLMEMSSSDPDIEDAVDNQIAADEFEQSTKSNPDQRSSTTKGIRHSEHLQQINALSDVNSDETDYSDANATSDFDTCPSPRRIPTLRANTDPLTTPGKIQAASRLSDPNKRSCRPISVDEFWTTVPPTLRTAGWGSKEATELVLNNLFYLTLRLSECPSSTEALKQLWVMLVRHRASNLRVVLRYLIILTSLAPAALLTHAQRLVTYLASEQAESVVYELMVEMQTIDGSGLSIERNPNFPFYKLSHSTLNNNIRAMNSKIARDPAKELVHSNSSPPVSVSTNSTPNDPELEAIYLDQCNNQHAPPKPVNHRTGMLPFLGMRRRSIVEETDGKNVPIEGERPKSITSHPIELTPIFVKPNHRASSELVSPNSGTETSPMQTVDVDIDVDLYPARRVTSASPDDPQATLRAKDFRRPSNILPSDRAQEELKYRSGTLPMTTDSRERYYNANRSPSKSSHSSDLQPTHTQPRKRFRTKSRSHVKPKVPFQTVSLPASISGIGPLPMPLPIGIPSLPTLYLVAFSEHDGKSVTTAVPPTAEQQSSDLQNILNHNCCPMPLTIPPQGVYRAPLNTWLTEPLVMSGNAVFTGSWPTTGARYPLVLLLIGGLAQCPTVRVDWTPHLSNLLLCSLLGIDHCRALVQEECKQLLVALLNLACPDQDWLGRLRLELAASCSNRTHLTSLPAPRKPKYRLTLDGGPCQDNFDLPTTAVLSSDPESQDISRRHSFTFLTKEDRHDPLRRQSTIPLGVDSQRSSHNQLYTSQSTTCVHGAQASPSLVDSAAPLVKNPAIIGSTFSLMSTDTLIPGHLGIAAPAATTPSAIDKITDSRKTQTRLQSSNHSNSENVLQKVINDLRQCLLASAGRPVWTWEDCTPKPSGKLILSVPNKPESPANTTDSTSRPDFECVVKAVARILALSSAEPSDAESCLQCHHGYPHEHASAHRLRSHGESIHRTSAPSNVCMVARLSQAALQMGLSCPNRHYANRSLQVFRVLGSHLDRASLSELVARLAETVSDTNEDLQDYVGELLHTLESIVTHLSSKSAFLTNRPLKRSSSQPSQARTAPASPRLGAGQPASHRPEFGHSVIAVCDRRKSQRHSTSAHLLTTEEPVVARPHTAPQSHASDDHNCATRTVSSDRARKQSGATSQHVFCHLAPEEQADLLCAIFWTGAFLLESDFTHEYFAGVRIVSSLVSLVCSDDNTPSNELKLAVRSEQLLNQMHLRPPFVGLLGLAIKGCSSPELVDPACQLLVCLIPFLSSPLVSPSSKSNIHTQLTYPITLLTLLPLLLTAWEEDPSTTGSSAENPSEQPGVLQGGFLGRGVCVTSNPTPRALGSWVSTNSRISQSATITQIPCSSGRSDSVTFPGSCSTGWMGHFNGYVFTPTHSSCSGSPGMSKVVQPLRPKNPICIQAASVLAQTALQLDSVRLANLALILRLYATGTFSKDADQWAKCVICYLLEGYAKNAPSLLHYLTTLLISGPHCLKLPLLKVASLMLQHVELGSPDLASSINHLLTSVSTQFLGTDLWPEVVHVIHVVVSRSSVLSEAPPCNMYTLSGLDPSGSGRVLDFVAATAALTVPLPESEPPRMELSGPVLEFTYKLPANSTDEVSSTRSSDDRRGYKRLPFLPWIDLFEHAASVWCQPGSCQSRLRERFYRLVGCFGLAAEHRIGAPRSPSVIFSQSTETLDHQLSVHSSSETTSVVDISNPDDIRLDDSSSMEQAAVFRDLDTYLDAQLMNIDFLGVPDGRLASTNEVEPRRPWGVRGQSITCHQDFNEAAESATGLLPTMRLPLLQQSSQCVRPNSTPSRTNTHLVSLDCSADDMDDATLLHDNSDRSRLSNEDDWQGTAKMEGSLKPVLVKHRSSETPVTFEALQCSSTALGSSSSSPSPQSICPVPSSSACNNLFSSTSLPLQSVAVSIHEAVRPCALFPSGCTASRRICSPVYEQAMNGSPTLSQGSVVSVPIMASSNSLNTSATDQAAQSELTSSKSLPLMTTVEKSGKRSRKPEDDTGSVIIYSTPSTQLFDDRFPNSEKTSPETDCSHVPSYRSHSTSNLSAAVTNGPACESPSKPPSTHAARWKFPLFRFHKNFRVKRQTFSADDLQHLARPKVSFVVPCASKLSEATALDHRSSSSSPSLHSPVAFPSSQRNSHGVLSEESATCDDHSSSLVSLDNKIIVTNPSMKRYEWCDMYPEEEYWLTHARQAVSSARVDVICELSTVFGLLASRCHVCVMTAVNLSGHSWGDASEFTNLVSTSQYIVNCLRPPLVVLKDLGLSLPETTLRNMSRLVEVYDTVQQWLCQSTTTISQRDSQATRDNLTRLLCDLLNFLRVSCETCADFQQAAALRQSPMLSEQIQYLLEHRTWFLNNAADTELDTLEPTELASPIHILDRLFLATKDQDASIDHEHLCQQAISRYREQMNRSPESRKSTSLIDDVIGMIRLYIREQLNTQTESDAFYVELPVLDTQSSSLWERCDSLINQLRL